MVPTLDGSDDADLAIDDNASERSLHGVLGRVAQHALTKLDELLPANPTPATD